MRWAASVVRSCSTRSRNVRSSSGDGTQRSRRLPIAARSTGGGVAASAARGLHSHESGSVVDGTVVPGASVEVGTSVVVAVTSVVTGTAVVVGAAVVDEPGGGAFSEA